MDAWISSLKCTTATWVQRDLHRVVEANVAASAFPEDESSSFPSGWTESWRRT